MSKERHKHILSFSITSLLRRKGKNLSIFLIYTLMVFLLGSVVFFVSAIKREAATTLKGAPDIVVQQIRAGRHDLIPTEYMEKVRTIRGVTKVIPRVWGYYFDGPTQSNYTIIGMDGNSYEAFRDRIPFLSPEEAPIGNGKVLIGKGIARSRGLKRGGHFYLLRSDGGLKTFEVSGIFSGRSSLLTHDLIVMSEKDVRELFLIPARYSIDLAVYVRNKEEIETIARKIGEVLPGTRAVIKEQITKSYETVFGWRSGLVFTALLGTVLAFAILSWDKATGLSADERKEIGILKALGWRIEDILEMKFWEGLTISLTAFLAGIILAYIHIFFFGSYLVAPAIKGWSVLYPPFNLTPYMDAGEVFMVFFITVVPYTVATLIPVWRSSTIDPDEVIRGI